MYNRGVNRQSIFFERGDYLFFIDLIQKWLRPDDLLLHTFTLMPNHFHFVFQQQAPHAMSCFPKRVTERFARWINRHSRRVGHLFQGRYKLKLVDDRGYLVQLSRYIHQNPVVAGLASAAEEWEFGSGEDFVGRSRFDFLTTEALLELAGGRATMSSSCATKR